MHHVIAETADVAQNAIVDPSAKIWHLAQVREHASIGPNCIISRGAYIGTGVSIGANSKIQNHAQVYEPALVGEGVFIGPGVIFTNDRYPRAVNPDGTIKSALDWESVGVHVETGASIGAGAICIAPITIGAWSLVAAGSVVTKDVRAHALVVGSPARQIGWVGYTGEKLEAVAGDVNKWKCVTTKDTFQVTETGDLVKD